MEKREMDGEHSLFCRMLTLGDINRSFFEGTLSFLDNLSGESIEWRSGWVDPPLEETEGKREEEVALLNGRREGLKELRTNEIIFFIYQNKKTNNLKFLHSAS
jgi:hypothetical protein